ncbi:MAG: hypothetical protein V8S14_02675 [Lachnospiraceae bacterium]
MKELELKYGCNPNQKPSKIHMKNGKKICHRSLKLHVRDISISCCTLMDGQSVTELKKATGLPAASSFKHVSPAGAAVGFPSSHTLA